MSSAPSDKVRVQQAFWRAVENLGLPPAAVLRVARLPVTLHLKPQSFVSTAQRFAIWRALEELAAEPDLWLRFVQATDAAGHQPMFLAACYAADLRDGLTRIARFKSVCTPEQLHVDESGNEVAICKMWPYATEPEPALSVETSFAFLVELGRRGTGKHLTPVRVEFARSRPDTSCYRDFFGCSVQCDAGRDRLVLKASDLDYPFPGHNAELLEILTPALTAALGDVHRRSTYAEQVDVVLKRALASGRPDVADVARTLGTSERTLQRRIAEEGSTFRHLVGRARQELARQLLADPSLSIGEIAYLLGYQDAAPFHRAFKAWEGVAPSTWRRGRARPR